MSSILRKPRLILFLVVFALVAWLCWRARGALTPFVIGLVVAYLILPLVNRVQRLMPQGLRARRLDRAVAILAVYLLGLLLVVAAMGTVIPPIVEQVNTLYDRIPDLYARGSEIVTETLAQYREVIPLTLQSRIEEQLRGFDPTTVVDVVLGGTLRVAGTIGSTLGFLLGLLVIPFWLFFILNDQGTVLQGALALFPRDLRPDAEAMRIIVDRVLSGYIRGQLLVASAIGVAIFVGLLLLRVPFSLLLALAAGVLALFPFVGAILGAVPALVVAFIESPQLALWVAGLFLVVQQIDNFFFSPRIMGQAVALHPALIMVVIVAGGALFGVLGALLAVPLTAILRDVVQYFYVRLGDTHNSPVEALTRIGYGDSATPLMIVATAPVVGAAD